MFANSGIFALIFYVAFWILIFWQLQRYKKSQGDGKNACIAHGIQAMFIGYLTALFFNFDSFATYVIAFFFVGYSFYLLLEQEEKITLLPPKTAFFQKKPAIIFFLVIIAAFVWFWNVKPFYINEKISHIALLADSKRCDRAVNLSDGQDWQKAGILKSYASLKYADLVKKCVSDEQGAEYSKKALDFLKVAAVYQPEYTRTWLLMGSFANVLAAAEKNPTEQEKILQEARGYFEKALKLSPKRAEIIVEQQKNYLLAKDYVTMEKLGENCIKIDPKQKGCYWYLGIAQIFSGDQINGKKNIEFALASGWKPAYLQLGVAYISQKNYEDAADAYDLLIGNYPNNASYRATLALLYKQIGKYTEAGKEAIKIFQLQPENPETIPFIRLLLGLNPNDLSLHSSLAHIYKQLGKEEEMKKELLILVSAYSQLISKSPKYPKHHFSLAVIYNELGEYEKSYQEALITLKLEPALKFDVEALIGTKLPSIYWDKYSKGKDRSTDTYQF